MNLFFQARYISLNVRKICSLNSYTSVINIYCLQCFFFLYYYYFFKLLQAERGFEHKFPLGNSDNATELGQLL